jgi:hypothetical protein
VEDQHHNWRVNQLTPRSIRQQQQADEKEEEEEEQKKRGEGVRHMLWALTFLSALGTQRFDYTAQRCQRAVYALCLRDCDVIYS